MLSIAEVVLAVVIIVMGISLERLIAHNRKEVRKLKRQLEKAGVIELDVEAE